MQNKHPNSPTNLTVCTAGTHALRSETLRLVASRKTVIITFFYFAFSLFLNSRAYTWKNCANSTAFSKLCSCCFCYCFKFRKSDKKRFLIWEWSFYWRCLHFKFLCFFVRVLRRIIWIFVICSSAPVFISGQVSQ